MSAAIEKAKAVIESSQKMKPGKRDALALMDAQPQVHERLQQAAQFYEHKEQ
ncbi:MAG: hypothetical protein R3F02_00575 [Thiolinea sp.]